VEAIAENRMTRLLVVEDDTDMREVMQLILERMGSDVTVAGSVEEATSLAAGRTFDLIISDIGLPGESGLELLTRLKLVGQVPAIAMSGYGADSDREESQRAGFTEHLVKPVAPAELREAVTRLLREKLSREKLSLENPLHRALQRP
jgi:CheY-like chemotaxis protein